jgi:hypothetical protein
MGRAGPVSATELAEVQALIERVLPDPAGFAGRLLQQAMSQWGDFAGPTATAFYTAATAEEVTDSDFVITPEPPDTDERPDADDPPVDINMLLAAALGACECWGLRSGCGLCHGQGSAGWVQPEPDLFEEFVRPALAMLPGRDEDSSSQQHTRPARQTEPGQYTEQGENA